MPTICPNCLRPVRAGANYCGFCGISLTISEGSALDSSAMEEQTVITNESESTKLPGPTYDQIGRTVSVIAIILLFLVIIAALTIRFWPDIIVWLGQIIPGLSVQ